MVLLNFELLHLSKQIFKKTTTTTTAVLVNTNAGRIEKLPQKRCIKEIYRNRLIAFVPSRIRSFARRAHTKNTSLGHIDLMLILSAPIVCMLRRNGQLGTTHTPRKRRKTKRERVYKTLVKDGVFALFYLSMHRMEFIHVESFGFIGFFRNQRMQKTGLIEY